VSYSIEFEPVRTIAMREDQIDNHTEYRDSNPFSRSVPTKSLDREARISFEHLLRELRPLAWAP
jgi:hypothetical protein